MSNSLVPTSHLDLRSPEVAASNDLSRLLRFSFGFGSSALLAVEKIAEILVLQVGDILPVPEMPGCVLGITNWRGEMLWLVDLDRLVGCKPLSLTLGRSLFLMVIKDAENTLGLVIEQVYDIELHDLQKLHPPAVGLFPNSLLPFVLGSLAGYQGTVLDATAIIQCRLWHKHADRN